jgi:hypothetical protein
VGCTDRKKKIISGQILADAMTSKENHLLHETRSFVFADEEVVEQGESKICGSLLSHGSDRLSVDCLRGAGHVSHPFETPNSEEDLLRADSNQGMTILHFVSFG